MKPNQKLYIEGREIILESLLSEGGYGYIWKARDTQSGRMIALKKMICQGEERVKVAQNEINILKKLPKHPNIVGYLGSQMSRNENNFVQAIILMEFCSGGSIFDLMAKNPNSRMTESQVLKITNDIVQGLKSMHSQNPPMAHRDIKIENVLYSDGKWKLCDFGSCSSQRVDFSLIDKSDYVTYEEEFEKNTTMMYRPPEMADPYQKYQVNEKVDIWMLGCVLFTICFFVHPFAESQKLAIVTAAFHIPKDSKYSEKLHDFIRLMLTPNPRLRPSIFEIDKILQSYNQLSSIQLNQQAIDIKNREKEFDKQMEQYNKNAEKIKKFDGDIPIEELMKIQEKIRNEQAQQKQKTNNKPQVQSNKQWNVQQNQKFNNTTNTFDSFGFNNNNSQTIQNWGNFPGGWDQFGSNSNPQVQNDFWGNFGNTQQNQTQQWTQNQASQNSWQITSGQSFTQPQKQTQQLNLLDLDSNQSSNNDGKIDLSNIVL